MTDASNPYQPPTSDVQQAPEVQVRSVAAGRGWDWIVEGFGYFKRAPGQWIAMVLIWALLIIVMSLIPLVNMAVSLLSPVFIGGMMIACRRQDNGEQPEVADLFAGFKEKFVPLLILGALMLGATIALTIVMAVLMMIVGGGAMMSGAAMGGEAGAWAAMGLGMLIVLLIALALSVPIAMAFWFAPVLVAVGDVQPVEAVKQSFNGCLKNIVPFLIYGLVALVISIIAVIPFGLGLLIWGPVLFGSVYAGYKDIYR